MGAAGSGAVVKGAGLRAVEGAGSGEGGKLFEGVNLEEIDGAFI